MQLTFRKQDVFSALLLVLAVLAGRWLIAQTPDRRELGERRAAVRFEPITLDADAFAPLWLAGAWAVSVEDPRFGGISALAVEGKQLLALSDAGVVVRLPKPGVQARATLSELPAGPGDPNFKRFRDSEAMVRTSDGWLVAFENRHALWEYDADFRRARGQVALAERGWGVNEGVEGIAKRSDRLLLFPETGTSVLAVGSDGSFAEVPLANAQGRFADAAALPDGRALVLLRQPTVLGFRNSLGWLKNEGDAYRIERRVTLGVGVLDNMEGLAAEPAATGVRLWLVSDNNFHRAQRTLLVALDVPARD